MNEALQVFFLSLPWLLAFGVPLAAMFSLLIGRRTASAWVAAYLLLLLYMPNNSYGLLDAAAGSNFYGRGTGMFFFSAINVLLFGLALQAFFTRRMKLQLPVAHNLTLPALLFMALLAGNVLVAAVLPEVRWFQLLAPSGLMNVFNFMLAFYVLVTVMRDRDDIDRLVNLLLFCAVTRGLWGLGRFLFLGGDPANYYANFQNLNVRITFFDINDGLIATLALFMAAWRLAQGQCRGLRSQLLHWAIVVLELTIVLFSHRRTGLLGLALAALLFALVQRPTLRFGLLAGYALLGVPLLAYKASQRFVGGGGGLLERIAPDIFTGGSLNLTTGRFAELYAAWLSVKESPWWGLGAWGDFDAFRFSELAWHGGNFTWMHSGVLHIMLKTGVLGVAVLGLAALLYLQFIRRAWRAVPAPQRGTLLLGLAGFLFALPNFLVGTPIIEFRTMQLLALCVALPYMAHACAVAAPVAGTAAARWRSAWALTPPPQVLQRLREGRL